LDGVKHRISTRTKKRFLREMLRYTDEALKYYPPEVGASTDVLKSIPKYWTFRQEIDFIDYMAREGFIKFTSSYHKKVFRLTKKGEEEARKL